MTYLSYEAAACSINHSYPNRNARSMSLFDKNTTKNPAFKRNTQNNSLDAGFYVERKLLSLRKVEIGLYAVVNSFV